MEAGGTSTGFVAERAADVSYDFGTNVQGTGEYGYIIKSDPDSSMNYRVDSRQEVGAWQIAFGGFISAGAVQNIGAYGEASYMTIDAGGV